MTKLIRITTYVTVAGMLFGLLTIAGAYFYLAPSLPNVGTLSDIQLQTPLRVYTRDGQLLGEFGDKRRTPILYQDVPEDFVKAFLAAEDDQFFNHYGISPKGLGRAVYQRLTRSRTQTGGSTITMQVAKNYFLTPERTIIRKVREIFLALQIEQQLTKEQILELYVNKIFFGHRSYGIAAAAQVYYGKSVSDLNLAQMAMIAGLPKAPSAYNPLANPPRALKRRNWILDRMRKLGYIDAATHAEAIAEPISARKHQVAIDIYAPYVAEMARSKAVELYGEEAYTAGLRVITTVDGHLQATATQAVKNGLHAYDLRHGFRGPAMHLEELTPEIKTETLKKFPTLGQLHAGIVTEVKEKSATIELAGEQSIELSWENGLADARPYLNASRKGPKPKTAGDVLKVGDVIRVLRVEENQWQLGQLPEAEASLVSMNPNNGALLALVGGYDFNKSKFNRVVQAKRQLGSNIKPFVYASALSNGLTPASTINDAPVVIDDAQLEGIWRPANDSGKFYGLTRLREALYKSRNLVSIRILRQMGLNKTRNYLTRFGFEKERLTKDLTLALGSPIFTPLETVTAYAAFANNGYKVEPYLIQEIHDSNDELIYQANPITVCDQACEEALAAQDTEEAEMDSEAVDALLDQALAEAQSEEAAEKTSTEEEPVEETVPEMRKAERIVDEKVAFIMDSIMRDVVQKGTARRARALKRPDIGGKTGTTNGPTDAWFSGYQANVVTTAWLGFDNNAVLGRGEYGGSAALPIWIEFMREALKNQPIVELQAPAGIVNVLIDKETGKRARPGQENTMFEYIQEDLLHTIEAPQQKDPETAVDLEELF